MHIEITGTGVANLAITYNLMIDAKKYDANGNNNSSNSGSVNKVACFEWKS